MGAADDGAHSQNEKIDIRLTFWPLPDIMVTSTSLPGTTSRAPSYSGLTPISSVSCRPASIWRMGDKTSQMTWYALILNATFYFVSGLDSWLYYEKEIFYDTVENIFTPLGKYIDRKPPHCVSSTSPKKALCQLGNAFLAVIRRNSAVVWLRVSIKWSPRFRGRAPPAFQTKCFPLPSLVKIPSSWPITALVEAATANQRRVM